MFGPDELIAHIEVKLCGVEPPITRTLELPFDLTLGVLHHVLQAAFGWHDTHLHRYEIGGLDFGPPDPEDADSPRRIFNSHEVRLIDFNLRYDARSIFIYEYDFGDRWIHEISLSIAPRDLALSYPRCIGGSRNGPPEDSGGPEGYSRFISAWADPNHSDHAEVSVWAPAGFDSEQFDVQATTSAIRSRLTNYK